MSRSILEEDLARLDANIAALKQKLDSLRALERGVVAKQTEVRRSAEAIRNDPQYRTNKIAAFSSTQSYQPWHGTNAAGTQLIKSLLSTVPESSWREIATLERELKEVQREAGPYRTALSRIRKKETEARKTARAASYKAAHDAFIGRARDGAQSIRHGLATNHPCPYCGRQLGSNPHADHIFPVSKGGRSIVANMVMVCSACNSKKAGQTLGRFIDEWKLDRDSICAALRSLGRDY